MATINMLRALLVAGAAFAALVALLYGQWAAALILVIGIAAHGVLWLHLHRHPADGPQRPPTAAR